MADEKIKTLDLDELLGQAKAVKVRRHGIEYELAQLSGLGVHKILQFQSLRKKVALMQVADNITEEQAAEIERLFDGMLSMLCDSLPLDEITYPEKTTILAFYFTETAPKKAKSPRKQLTGATPSPS
jgi:hypothetical protein